MRGSPLRSAYRHRRSVRFAGVVLAERHYMHEERALAGGDETSRARHEGAPAAVVVPQTPISARMSAVRRSRTDGERIISAYLKARGITSRFCAADLAGTPDIVIDEVKLAIFYHGCFWHGHRRCKLAGLPLNNRPFWEQKQAVNRRRDKKVLKLLKDEGWATFVIWKCQLKKQNRLRRLTKELDRLKEAKVRRS